MQAVATTLNRGDSMHFRESWSSGPKALNMHVVEILCLQGKELSYRTLHKSLALGGWECPDDGNGSSWQHVAS